MRRTLKCSLILNCLLLGSLLYLLASRTRAPLSPQTGLVLDNPPAPSEGVAAPLPAVSSSFPTFRWSQLESPDYRVYVANLRAVACPEQTIHDIIVADIGALYSARRQQFGLDGSGTGAWSRSEETELAASVLGTTAKTAAVESEHSQAPSMPLVFQKVDVAALGLAPGQVKAIDELRQQFMDQIGGSGQDAADPAYRERWQQAQPESDEMLRGMIGINAFQNYQLQAAGANPLSETNQNP